MSSPYSSTSSSSIASMFSSSERSDITTPSIITSRFSFTTRRLPTASLTTIWR